VGTVTMQSIKVDLHITAHPARAAMAESLHARFPSARMWMDDVCTGAWRNIRQAWEAPIPEGVTHRLVIEEDTDPCENFLEGVNAALAARPDDLIGFFCGGKSLLAAREQGLSWVEYWGRGWGPAMCVPTSILPGMTDWIERRFNPKFPSCDMRFLQWLIEHKRPFLATAPSLVQHRADAIPTTPTDDPNALRQSHWVATDARGINWNTPALYCGRAQWQVNQLRARYLRAG
jgi:hypothetical protein